MEKEQSTSCCSGGAANGPRRVFRSKCCPSPAPAKPLRKITHEWSLKDKIGHIRCRLGSFRMDYKVSPGLYALGNPGPDSDVFASSNYKLSFDILRVSLKGLDAWILVLDTKGINVWCAAGKGTFGTAELVKRVTDEGLGEAVSHRRIIVPQLGAPGIAAHTVKEATGFRAVYGPVDAKDLLKFVGSGYKASPEMRKVRFGFSDRVVLTPMELFPALKYYPLFAIFVLFVFGLNSGGVSFNEAFSLGDPFLAHGMTAIISGGVLTPAFLPFIPFRPFALKGWIAGAVTTALLQAVFFRNMGWQLAAASFIFFPLVSSYIALQFTGSTTFTSPSGVKKELRFALPVYASGTALSLMLVLVFKIAQWVRL